MKAFQENKISELTHSLDDMTHKYALLNERYSTSEDLLRKSEKKYESAMQTIASLTACVNKLRGLNAKDAKTFQVRDNTLTR